MNATSSRRYNLIVRPERQHRQCGPVLCPITPADNIIAVVTVETTDLPLGCNNRHDRCNRQFLRRLGYFEDAHK
jgi:hypothetical protein